ncbi:MAG: adenylate/guanylate cyclase domain-containing protein, partial [Alphaproteobacteria bacterium]
HAFNRMLFALRWFETYVPRTLVRRMVRHGDAEHLRSAEREVSVLFTDIEGFTRLSEAMSAEEVAGFLNVHFAVMSRCIEEEGGAIDKYTGDGLMAFWGAPDDASDHAERAVRAALAIRRAVSERAGSPRIRIGIHTGPAVAGNIGGADRLNYTIVGDTVNIAARLEGACKTLVEPGEGVAILISEATARRLPGDVARRELGARDLPGRSEKVRVFSV